MFTAILALVVLAVVAKVAVKVLAAAERADEPKAAAKKHSRYKW